jgi:hypothetical protein
VVMRSASTRNGEFMKVARDIFSDFFRRQVQAGIALPHRSLLRSLNALVYLTAPWPTQRIPSITLASGS